LRDATQVGLRPPWVWNASVRGSRAWSERGAQLLALLWSHMLPMLPACADASARRRGALEQAIEEAREYRR